MAVATLGRRERKKLERRSEIVRCARDLFRRLGYEATSVEQIAEAADVSPGTVYNFFPSKIEILMDFFSSDLEEKLTRSFESLGPPPSDPHEGILRLVAAQMRTIDGLSRRYVKLVVTQTMLMGRDSAAGQADAAGDAAITAGLAKLIRHYQNAGALSAGIDADRRAWLIFCTVNGEFCLSLADEKITIEQRLATVRELLEAVLPRAPEAMGQGRS